MFQRMSMQKQSYRRNPPLAINVMSLMKIKKGSVYAVGKYFTQKENIIEFVVS